MAGAEIIKKLKSLASPKNVAGMARFGIRPKAEVLGVPMPVLRRLAKETGKNHNLARRLWRSGVHEAKILASMLEESEKVSGAQMNEWVGNFDSWDVCDQVCLNLFFNHPLAFKKCAQWSKNNKEFTRRAGFALIAMAAFKNKQAKDINFIKLFPLIKKYSTDERHYVKKAVNWALRQIGKRNSRLNEKAIALAREISKINSKSAKWIAADALRELQSDLVKRRLLTVKI